MDLYLFLGLFDTGQSIYELFLKEYNFSHSQFSSVTDSSLYKVSFMDSSLFTFSMESSFFSSCLGNYANKFLSMYFLLLADTISANSVALCHFHSSHALFCSVLWAWGARGFLCLSGTPFYSPAYWLVVTFWSGLFLLQRKSSVSSATENSIPSFDL